LNNQEPSGTLEASSLEGLMLTKEAVDKVSKLARLRLTEQEVEEFSRQLSAVLENFNQIAQIDTDGVEPLVTPVEIEHQLRADETSDKDGDKILETAPEKSGRLYRVPPVV
jgi:aspartyl-tRNA(Asn)/glutamyl-tRNA(Gln) amidotransferase subunit C